MAAAEEFAALTLACAVALCGAVDVDQGIATVAAIDTVIAHGPGPRWALLGPFMTLHLSGGSGGIGHVRSPRHRVRKLVAGPGRCFVHPITSVSSGRWNS